MKMKHVNFSRDILRMSFFYVHILNLSLSNEMVNLDELVKE